MATPEFPVSAPATEKPVGRRRWIPLSLRLFAAILGSFAIPGIWVATCGYRQIAAIREIEREGASVELLWRGPTWLRERLGPEWLPAFAEVGEVSLVTCKDDVRTLAQISRFPNLRGLDCGYCDVSDAALLQLGRLPRLRAIHFDSERVTDAGLATLGRLTNLRTLWLHNAQVTDAGVNDLRKTFRGLWIDR